MFILDFTGRSLTKAAAAAGTALALAVSLAGPALAADGDIGAEKAESIALEQAGLTGEEVSRLRTVRDRDDGAWEYEVEFFTDEAEYDYTVGTDGAVWQESWELLRRGRQTDGDIGAAGAQAAALAHAELTETETLDLAARRELDDGYLEYEVRWQTEDYAYEYVVDGAAGTVWQWEKTMLPAPRTDAAGDLGADTARDTALARAGLTLEQVTGLRVEWETTDDYSGFGGGLRDVYEISFRQGGNEYECVVDAVTGEVLEYECEYDD